MSIIDKFSLEGKCSIVTGAAMGLGKSMALAMAEMGSNIVIADMNADRAEQVAQDIRSRFESEAVAFPVMSLMKRVSPDW